MAEYIPGDPQKVLDKIWQLADERFARGVPCKKGLKELLAALEDMGLPRIVASSSPRNMIEMNLQTTGTARYFHDVVSGDVYKRQVFDWCVDAVKDWKRRRDWENRNR